RVMRTSNAYAFVDPKPSKSELPTGTAFPELALEMPRVLDPDNRLHQALMRLGMALRSGPADAKAAQIVHTKNAPTGFLLARVRPREWRIRAAETPAQHFVKGFPQQPNAPRSGACPGH